MCDRVRLTHAGTGGVLSAWHLSIKGAKFRALAAALLVLLADAFLLQLVSATRPVQIVPDEWVIHYVTQAPLPPGETLTDREPDPMFGVSRVSCRAAPDAAPAMSTPLQGTPVEPTRFARCTFSRFSFAYLFSEGRPLVMAQPYVLAYLAAVPSPWAPDYQFLTGAVGKHQAELAATLPARGSLLDVSARLGYVACTTLVALLLFRSMRSLPTVRLGFAWAALRRSPAAATLMLAAAALPVAAWLGLAGPPQIEAIPSGVPVGTEALLWSLAFICILAPLTEEILFRAWLIPHLGQVFRTEVAGALSVVAFVAVHWPFDPLASLFGTVVAGCLFTVIWMQTRSLWLCFLAHAFWNLGVTIRDEGLAKMFFSL